MYCNKCGEPIPNGSRTCNHCGATQPQIQPQQQYRQAPPPQYRQVPQQAKQGLSPILIVGIVFFGAIFLLIAIINMGGSNKTNPDNDMSADLSVLSTASSTEKPNVTQKSDITETTEAEITQQETSISITGHHLTTNSIGDNVLVVDYDFYNGEDEPISFSWTCTDQCFQNGVECSTFVLVDEVDTHKQTADVQPGVTLSLSVAYKLEDMSDVNIIVKELIGDKEYINQTFSPQS